MSCMLFRSAVMAVMLVTSMGEIPLYPSFPYAEATPLQRIAIQLSGPSCASQHANISSALSALPGVRAVDLTSVPDHALVDIDSGSLSAQDLAETVRRLQVSKEACRVEPMQSCISAGPLGDSDRQATDHALVTH